MNTLVKFTGMLLLFAFKVSANTAANFDFNYSQQISQSDFLAASLDQILPLPAQINTGVVDVETVKAKYHIPERTMTFTLKIKNGSDKPIQIVEFVT